MNTIKINLLHTKNSKQHIASAGIYTGFGATWAQAVDDLALKVQNAVDGNNRRWLILCKNGTILVGTAECGNKGGGYSIVHPAQQGKFAGIVAVAAHLDLQAAMRAHACDYEGIVWEGAVQ